MFTKLQDWINAIKQGKNITIKIFYEKIKRKEITVIKFKLGADFNQADIFLKDVDFKAKNIFLVKGICR